MNFWPVPQDKSQVIRVQFLHETRHLIGDSARFIYVTSNLIGQDWLFNWKVLRCRVLPGLSHTVVITWTDQGHSVQCYLYKSLRLIIVSDEILLRCLEQRSKFNYHKMNLIILHITINKQLPSMIAANFSPFSPEEKYSTPKLTNIFL